MHEDDKYQYCPPWAYAEVTDDGTWIALDPECANSDPLVKLRTENEAADGD